MWLGKHFPYFHNWKRRNTHLWKIIWWGRKISIPVYICAFVYFSVYEYACVYMSVFVRVCMFVLVCVHTQLSVCMCLCVGGLRISSWNLSVCGHISVLSASKIIESKQVSLDLDSHVYYLLQHFSHKCWESQHDWLCLPFTFWPLRPDFSISDLELLLFMYHYLASLLSWSLCGTITHLLLKSLWACCRWIYHSLSFCLYNSWL